MGAAGVVGVVRQRGANRVEGLLVPRTRSCLRIWFCSPVGLHLQFMNVAISRQEPSHKKLPPAVQGLAEGGRGEQQAGPRTSKGIERAFTSTRLLTRRSCTSCTSRFAPW